MPKTDIIVACYNGIADAVEMHQSLKNYTKDYRLIVVDNHSTDGTREYFESQDGVEVIRLDKNYGFAGAINKALERVEAPNVALLNSDLILTDGWLERILYWKDNFPAPIGAIGPTSNYVGGQQKIQMTERNADDQAKKQTKEFEKQPLLETAFLSFFCCVLDSQMVKDLGPLDDWGPGFEDNAYCIRAWEQGWRLLIARDVFVGHKGSRTLLREFGDRNLTLDHRFDYYEKFYKQLGTPKVVATYRVKNDHANFRKSLEATSKIVDAIYVWDDNSSPSLKKIISSFPKVEKYYESHLPFDEFRDRSALLSWAKGSKYQWALALDADEILEPKLTYKKLHQLIKVPDPIIRSFIFHETTFWFKNFFRNDGIWRGQAHDRLFKLNLNEELKPGTDKGFHCSTTPVFPLECRRATTLRIEHFGYLNPKKRVEKHKFYEEQDTDKRPELIGGADYAHLLDDGPIQVCKYLPDNHLALNLLTREDELKEIAAICSDLWGLPQEINILAEGEETKQIELLRELFGANVYIDSEKMGLSEKRNFLLEKTKERWAFFLDADEKISQPFLLRLLLDVNPPAYLFYMKNIQKDRRVSISENVRLFRTDLDLKFSGRIHETVEDSLKAKTNEGDVKIAPFPIFHFGYLKEDKFVAEKLEKYYQILLEELETRPKDAKVHFSLGLHYLNLDQEEKAIEYFEKAVELNPDFSAAKKEIVRWHIQESSKLLGEFVPQLPNSHPLKPKLTGMMRTLGQMNEEPLIIGDSGADRIQS